MPINLQQSLSIPSKQELDHITQWMIVLPKDQPDVIKQLAYGDLMSKKYKPSHIATTIHLPNTHASHVCYASIDNTMSTFDLLTLGRKMFIRDNNIHALGLVVLGFSNDLAYRVAEALLSAVMAAVAVMPSYKSIQPKPFMLKKILLYGVRSRDNFRQCFAIAKANDLVRSLSIMPANVLTPKTYLKQVKKIAKANKWGLDFYGMSELNKKKAGAFLAVAEGSDSKEAGIIRLRYTPKKKTKAKIVLVGKGICYDTGGTNLKPAKSMFGMHEDMQGSAVALGVLLALTQLEYDRPVECWMAIATNHIGPKAYKPNDVITAVDGTTIEIVDTDAEGRMVLADTLALASKQKPALIIDYATLTGACIYAIGNAYSGVFSNQQQWWQKLIEIGQDCGERVWTFPLDDDFGNMIKSDIADIKQCSLDSGVDHILAALFLKHFVKHNTPWIHIDLSSSHRKGGLAHIPTDTIGFGVRYSVNLLLHNNLID